MILRGLPQRMNLRGNGCWYMHIFGFLFEQHKVFEHQGCCKTKIKGAGQDGFGEFILRGGIAPAARIDHADHQSRINASFCAHRHRLRRDGQSRRRQVIIDEFHGLRQARLFAHKKYFTDDIQNRFHDIEILLRCRHHHRQGTIDSPIHTA